MNSYIATNIRSLCTETFVYITFIRYWFLYSKTGIKENMAQVTNLYRFSFLSSVHSICSYSFRVKKKRISREPGSFSCVVFLLLVFFFLFFYLYHRFSFVPFSLCRRKGNKTLLEFLEVCALGAGMAGH